MRYTSLFILIVILFSACAPTVTEIGTINMISTRNIETDFNYSQISSYKGASEREIKKTKSTTIQDAVNEVVRREPGGEFLMNVKLYSVERSGSYYYAVEGDVWGGQESVNYRGFKLGDRVIWSVRKNMKTGVIKSLKNNTECLVLVDDSDKIIEISYDKISKYLQD